MIEERSSLVYVTGKGKIEQPKPVTERPKTDGVVRILLKRLGGNKMVSVVTGVDLDANALADLGRDLKRKCGTGGTVKDFQIEIQGDKRNVLKAELEKRGYTVKLAGG
ncbi:stress response translation initiation inhibitor YciH [Hallerella succinigenes]|uniref:Translation initiation factor 1 (eIF-1/SUI1) n=1 Tax=Hallerella succinigenes TaxID=1896222 RepID=A0A2M9A8P0_9BACT|nr:stress response translation initiation inhibitor YciH [Hallerella succinigenes]MDD6092577.1 stress response translation initiation inhibitor YciH [Hallerella succinigenes]PJJ42038.1 translation initiation factor 1 (eIF-1/SUI1) [Hallerella succinigenes]